MKILFTGGGTHGHFYPIMAIIKEVNKIVAERNLIKPKLYFLAPEEYDEKLLYENGVEFKKNPAGKMRRYFSIKNFFDIFKTAWGSVVALFQVFVIFPDVIFSKGGYASFPVVLAARIFSIPLIIHESDSVPGKVNVWSADFATRIAVSFPEAAKYLAKGNIAFTGNPVREELYSINTENAHEFLKLDKNVPTILVLGGSQGAQKINELIVEALPELVKEYQILHQAGKGKLEEAQKISNILLEKSEFKDRYRAFEFLDVVSLSMAYGASDLVISRGGSTIFEIALLGLPSIIIPLSSSSNNHQQKNAYTYARTNAAIVMEEGNLSPHILIAEIERIMKNDELKQSMIKAAKKFAHPKAAHTIALGIVDVALKHESG